MPLLFPGPLNVLQGLPTVSGPCRRPCGSLRKEVIGGNLYSRTHERSSSLLKFLNKSFIFPQNLNPSGRPTLVYTKYPGKWS